jgi:hypothetical protein
MEPLESILSFVDAGRERGTAAASAHKVVVGVEMFCRRDLDPATQEVPLRCDRELDTLGECSASKLKRLTTDKNRDKIRRAVVRFWLDI